MLQKIPSNRENKCFQLTTSEEIKLFFGSSLAWTTSDSHNKKSEMPSSIKLFHRVFFIGCLVTYIFEDHTLQPKKEEPKYNKLYKLGSFLTTLSRTYKECYSIHQENFKQSTKVWSSIRVDHTWSNICQQKLLNAGTRFGCLQMVRVEFLSLKYYWLTHLTFNTICKTVDFS